MLNFAVATLFFCRSDIYRFTLTFSTVFSLVMLFLNEGYLCSGDSRKIGISKVHIHLSSHEKLKKAKEEANVFPRNMCRIFIVCTSSPIIENTSSAKGTSAGGTSTEYTSTEMQHTESPETHVNRNKM